MNKETEMPHQMKTAGNCLRRPLTLKHHETEVERVHEGNSRPYLRYGVLTVHTLHTLHTSIQSVLLLSM